MAPKSKQAARRARAKATAQPQPTPADDQQAPLDSDYELSLFDQLPLEARLDVRDVATVLMNTYGGMPVPIAMASANRMRRQQRHLFDDILSSIPAEQRPRPQPESARQAAEPLQPFSGRGRRLDED